jgi:hypothetical protein
VLGGVSPDPQKEEEEEEEAVSFVKSLIFYVILKKY